MSSNGVFVSGPNRRHVRGAVCLAPLLALVASWVVFLPSARADDAALADKLWRAGREFFLQKNYVEACPKFEASLKLDRQLGTLLNLAECNAYLGKLATAQGEWSEAIEWAKKNLAIDPLDKKSTERLKYASDWSHDLEPRVPKLILDVAHKVPGLALLRNGELVDPALFGLDQPLDPGSYKIAVQRGEQLLEERNVTLSEGKTEHMAFDLAAIDARVPPAPKGPGPGPQPPGPQPPSEPPSNAQRIAGIAVTATMGAAVLIAGGLELGAIVKKGQADRDDGCVNKFCSPQGLDAANQAKRLAEGGQWLGITGLVGLAVGLTVFFTAPSPPEPAAAPAPGPSAFALPWLSPAGAGLVLGGTM